MAEAEGGSEQDDVSFLRTVSEYDPINGNWSQCIIVDCGLFAFAYADLIGYRS